MTNRSKLVRYAQELPVRSAQGEACETSTAQRGPQSQPTGRLPERWATSPRSSCSAWAAWGNLRRPGRTGKSNRPANRGTGFGPSREGLERAGDHAFFTGAGNYWGVRRRSQDGEQAGPNEGVKHAACTVDSKHEPDGASASGSVVALHSAGPAGPGVLQPEISAAGEVLLVAHPARRDPAALRYHFRTLSIALNLQCNRHLAGLLRAL